MRLNPSPYVDQEVQAELFQRNTQELILWTRDAIILDKTIEFFNISQHFALIGVILEGDLFYNCSAKPGVNCQAEDAFFRTLRQSGRKKRREARDAPGTEPKEYKI